MILLLKGAVLGSGFSVRLKSKYPAANAGHSKMLPRVTTTCRYGRGVQIELCCFLENSCEGAGAAEIIRACQRGRLSSFS